MKTIGFFGDSFCSDQTTQNYDTYIDKLKNYYKLEIVNLGISGSSIEDLLLLQLNPFIKSKKCPDICIFIWTNLGRLFNRKIRSITPNSIIANLSANAGIKSRIPWCVSESHDDPIANASKMYYEYLYDQELEEIRYNSLLKYIDSDILVNINSKIIHLWSFGNVNDYSKDIYKNNKIKYNYRWKTGVEIRPPLMSLSLIDNEIISMINDDRPNHLEGEEKNNLLFEYIKDAIDNYENGKLIDMKLPKEKKE